MINFKILMYLAIICHIVSSTTVKFIDLKSWTEHAINASDSYTSYPTKSNAWNSKSPKNNESQHSLPLHLIKPALVHIYNYGPYGSKVDVYNHHKKIGEAGSFNLTRFNNNNIGRVYLPKGDHSLSLQPYYKDGKSEDLLSMHFVKVHILPKSPNHFLKKREPIFNNANKYTPKHKANVQWDDDSVPKSHEDDDDDDDDDDDEVDSLDEDDDEDDDNDDDDDDDDNDSDKDGKWDKSYNKDAEMDGNWWKWHKKGGWKMGKKKEKKIIVLSTINHSEPTTPAPITVTYTSTVDHTSTIPEPPTPSPREIMVTQTVQKPGTTETVNKTGPTVTTTVTTTNAAPSTVSATVLLPVLVNTVTEYRDIRNIPSASSGVESDRVVTVTIAGGLTTIMPSPITVTNNPVTVTLNGQITTIFPEPVTITNPPVTVTNEPKTITSLVNVEVTHFLLRQTVKQTVYETDTKVVTVAFTSHNEVVQTIYGGTSTKTENVVVTVFSTRSRTSTTTATPTPSLTPS